MASDVATQRPNFVQQLLARPLIPLHPQSNEKTNKPYSRELASLIVNALFHPLVESTLHLMNGDLFSAHLLVRKMQEDPMGKWLHGILHLHEGDYANVKCWYRDMPPDLLATHFQGGKRAAYAHVDRVAVASGKSEAQCRQTSATAEVADDCDPPPARADVDERAVREAMWAELVHVLERNEREHGWARDVEGSRFYSKDEGHVAVKKSSMLLGEGHRVF